MRRDKYKKPIVVSEIGCNHKGKIENCKRTYLTFKRM